MWIGQNAVPEQDQSVVVGEPHCRVAGLLRLKDGQPLAAESIDPCGNPSVRSLAVNDDRRRTRGRCHADLDVEQRLPSQRHERVPSLGTFAVGADERADRCCPVLPRHAAIMAFPRR